MADGGETNVMADGREEPKTPPVKPPEGMRDFDKAKIVCLLPSVNLTPVGNTMVCVPYNVIDYCGHDTNFTPTVKLTGVRSMVYRSITQHVHGDEAGTGGGPQSGTRGGICEPIEHSATVKAEGSYLMRDGDKCWMNNKNTIGKCVLVESTELHQLPQPKPKTDKERREEALKKKIDELKKDVEAGKDSWNPYTMARNSLRNESIANLESQLSDLQSGTTRGAFSQVNDGVVAGVDGLVEGGEALIGGAGTVIGGAGSVGYDVITGDFGGAGQTLSNAGTAISNTASSAVSTLSDPSSWFQGTRDAWNTGQYGSAIGGVAPEVAGVAGIAKSGAKKLFGAATKDTGETMAEAAARRTAAAKAAGEKLKDSELLVTNKNGVRISKKYKRPDWRTKTKRDVWEKALKDGDGKVIDPKTGKEIRPGDKWDMGHERGHEFWKQQENAQARGITREQFINEYNNPGHVRPELPSSNQGHSMELPSNIYLGD
jgi:Domain of unknown function (DUF4150)/HNH/ENDO VII superfamily nuclease with conserved GHE residues